MVLKMANWKVKNYQEIQSEGRTIATLSDGLDFPDSYDTSHLMAAAPELYLALEQALKADGKDASWAALAQAALAKADGEQS